MSYQVIAPCVIAKQQGELGNREFYQGGIIPWLSDEQAEHFVAEKLVVDLGGSDDDETDGDDGKPKKAAPKADWVEFAVADGYDRDEVEAMSKADIQALFD